MKFISLFLLLSVSLAPINLAAWQKQGDVPITKASLKPIEPQWATKVIENHPEGGVGAVILYDRIQNDRAAPQEIAVKSIYYYPDGSLFAEVDLQELPLTQDTQRHGSSVSYYEDG